MHEEDELLEGEELGMPLDMADEDDDDLLDDEEESDIPEGMHEVEESY